MNAICRSWYNLDAVIFIFMVDIYTRSKMKPGFQIVAGAYSSYVTAPVAEEGSGFAASVLEMKKTGDLYLVTHKNRFLDTCLKIFFYAIALAFTFLWTSFLWGIFYSEGNLTWEIRLACFLIGLILHIPFVLLTFRIQKRWIRIALATVLIPVLLVHFGFLVMLWDSWLWGGGWALCVVGIAYYQLFKGVIHDQKSN